jgi:dihydroxyacetone kinase
MEKAGSKPGEKTILDALCPAVEALQRECGDEPAKAFQIAAQAAAKGSESTRSMLSKHGRAAYYGEKSIGVIDGGSVVGKLIFEALASYFSPISTT